MSDIDKDIEKNVINKLEGIRVCGDKAELWNFEAGTILSLIKKQDKELETYKKIAERYEKECRMFRAFCRKIRKTEKRNVDEFNQGREYAYIQFLNLINGEQNWEHEGKHFDEVDQELENWARKEVENGK